MVGNSPRVLGVESQPLHVLRKGAVARRSITAAGAVRSRYAETLWNEGSEHPRVLYIIDGVIDVLSKSLRRRRKRSTEHGFVDEVQSKLERMASRGVAQVVADLVFALIAQVGEKSDGSGELVVAKSFEAGNRERCGAEGKRQREAQIGVPRLREMQQAGAENQIPQPGW